MKSPIAFFQPLGRALMLPIAVLPVASLMLRLGQADLLNIAFLAAAGDVIFQNLGLLFAVGVATGFARDGNGAASLASVVCFLVATRGAQVFLLPPPELLASLPETAQATVAASWRAAAIAKLDVPIGIIAGLIGGTFYNRFATVTFPDYLAFFAGRRFVSIMSGVAGLGVAAVLGAGYAGINTGMALLSHVVTASGAVGLFIYGVLNRLLLVTGLHHLLNNVVWFVVGDYHGVTGDLRRFFAGDPSAGGFISGFFPVMMFGLPAACLAIYHCAIPARRAAISGLLFSLALTSLLTGVTEPIEFSFMFLAPVLYGLHAVLTGLSAVLMNALGIKLGFGFSAGLFDYVLNFGKATHPLLLIPVGLVYAALYYVLFRYAIVRFDLPTLGRERDESIAAPATTSKGSARGAAYLKALGGAENIVEVGACTTRLRLIVARADAVSDTHLKILGARGVLRPSPTAVQVVVGPVADTIAMELRHAIEHRTTAPHFDEDASSPASQPQRAPLAAAATTSQALPAAIIAAVGGSANIMEGERYHGRIRLRVARRDLVVEDQLQAAGARVVAWLEDDLLHILIPAHN